MYLFAIGLPEFAEQDWRIRSRGLAFYGGFLWIHGELDMAERMLYQSIHNPSEQLTLEDRIDLALRQSSYGLILDTLGRHEEATPYHMIARESLTNLYGPMHVSVHRAALNEASNALYMKALDRASFLSSQAKMFFQTSPRAWTSELMECETLLAAIALLTGEVQQSLDHLDSLFEIGRERSERTYRWNDYATPLLAAALIESGDRSARLDEIYTDCVEIRNKLGSAHPWIVLLSPYFEQAESEWVALWTDG
jgi:tetratricopeptide (TPR) repeat protein